LSEKGPAIVRTLRSTPMPVDRAIVDTGNLMKLVTEVMLFRFGAYAELFGRRQRLQLGLSDSNVAQVAEYLKIGTTTLVVDMAEAGMLRDAPRLAKPVAALHAIIGDPGLTATGRLAEGRRCTALELQRFYLERARAFVAAAPATSIQASEVVALWALTLDDLAAGRFDAQFGRLDWVTKRALLERAGAGASAAERKKIDLRYHELGEGYLAQLQQAGLAPELVSREEIALAVQRPPEGTPAFARGHLVKRLAAEGTGASVSWRKVRVGGLTGKVIRLDDYRGPRAP
jgi:proteasome accessory factor A